MNDFRFLAAAQSITMLLSLGSSLPSSNSKGLSSTYLVIV
jgi:hypothetical protein